MSPEPPVVIVGAGLAGLACARRLFEAGTPFLLVEASDAVGGRVRTDVVDGFRLDRGFQIYLTAYPEASRVLDYESLKLCRFTRGALVRYSGRFHRLADPRRRPLAALRSAFNPVGSLFDKFRLAVLGARLLAGKPYSGFDAPDRLAIDFLRHQGGFSPAMIERFLRPFFGGVFLERGLITSSRFCRFVLRTFAAGDGAVPAEGMGRIPDQLAAKLPADSVRLDTPVGRIEEGAVITSGGERIAARAAVVATEGPAAARLLGDFRSPPHHATVTLYYDAPQPPVDEPTLVLNGDGTGVVNNLVVMSRASPAYAPPGRHLVAASLVEPPDGGDADWDRQARDHLQDWYGDAVSEWRLLRAYRVEHALPALAGGDLRPAQRPVRLRPGIYVCGDHRDNPSIDGALTSGFRTAQAVMADLHDR